MSTFKEKFEKIKSRKATICIIGLGYVGLPLLLQSSKCGFNTTGLDIDKQKIKILNSGKSYIEHITSKKIKEAKKNKVLFTTNPKIVNKSDIIILCVPTPLNKHREPDMQFINKTLELIIPYLKKGQAISLESTSYPGTTEELIAQRIQDRGFKVGKDFFIIYSPEREDPGNIEFKIDEIPKVISGVTNNCLKIAKAFYESVFKKTVSVSSTQTAEMTKLLENIHRAVNIGLVNEMKIVADKMDINIHEVINAAATKPFGFTAFYPGPGLGGHCIPIDPFYLTWKAREYGIHTRFIELAGEINSSMPKYVVSKCIGMMNKDHKTIMGSKILILGISYKKNIDDMRESPSVEIMEILSNLGASLSYHDPHVPVFPKMRDHNFNMKSININSNKLKNFDLVLIATDHDLVDYELVLKNANLIVDTRGVYKKSYKKVLRA